MKEKIEVGYQAFVSDGGEAFGAVREVSPDGLVLDVENAGDSLFIVPLDVWRRCIPRRSSSTGASWTAAFGRRSATHTTLKTPNTGNQGVEFGNRI